MGLPCDWQITKQRVSQRGQYLLESGQWSDCKFIVGQEPQQEILEGHKLFLAMSSPVFEAMFYGSMAEKNDPIPIRDVQPEAFKTLLEYIYTDRIDLESFEIACELCYCAKKYMLPYLVEECTKYLWSDLSPKRVCRAYEFAKLFEEPVLLDKCMQIMCAKTNEILRESSWDDVEMSTISTLFDQDCLLVDTEIELFEALLRWSKAECARRALSPADPKALRSVAGNLIEKIRFLTLTPQQFADGPGKSQLLTRDEAFAILMNVSSRDSDTGMPDGFSTETRKRRDAKVKPKETLTLSSSLADTTLGRLGPGWITVSSTMRSHCVPRIGSPRMYRTYSPTLNAASDGAGQIFQRLNEPEPAASNAVRSWAVAGNDAAAAAAVDIVDPPPTPPRPNWEDHPGGSESGPRDGPKHYCRRSVRFASSGECLNHSVLDCSITFKVDKNICVIGVQVPTQTDRATFTQPLRNYTEILYAHLLDSDGSRLTYTHFTTLVSCDSHVEIGFNRPVYIQKNKVYRVGVVFNKAGQYPIGDYSKDVVCHGVHFSFGVGRSAESVRDGLIRTIVFTNH